MALIPISKSLKKNEKNKQIPNKKNLPLITRWLRKRIPCTSCVKSCHVLTIIFFSLSGNTVLHAAVVMEKLGSRQNPRFNDGLRYWCCARRGKKTKKETFTRLPRRQPEAPQLVGLPIFFL